MSLARTVLLSATLALTGLPAASKEWRLNCKMTGYSDMLVSTSWAGQLPHTKRAVQNLIPEKAVHLIDGGGTHIEGTDQFGTVERQGRMWLLKYTAHHERFGRSRITYSFNMGTNKITARGVLQKPANNARIDRVPGTCVMER